ncbi:hypothetical protein ACOI1H_23290, partial [Loktanella sp. DJP18]|uniref:hypothetical protein n=1 Tax=Loktanella sp. DJP18 TaxID=3409788 RepID=UPI003BB57791
NRNGWAHQIGIGGRITPEYAILSQKLLNIALVFSEMHDEHCHLKYSKNANIIRRYALMEEVRELVSKKLSMEELEGVYQFV